MAAVTLLSACRATPSEKDRATPATGGELVASLRSEPGNYNRYFEASAAADLVSLLTQDRLVRVNRATDALEPGLAERWEIAPDGTTVTLTLRQGVRFSDGEPFSSADVVFSFTAAYEAPGSRIGQSLMVGGKPFAVSAPDPSTVTIRFPEPFAPGVRVLENLPILPRHRLEAAFKAGTMEKAWAAGTTLSEVAGLGPFVLTEHVAGQRLVFGRNPHYWNTAEDGTRLPYLDRLRVEIVPDQNAEALRLESGAIDLMANGDIRPDDYARFKRLADQGRIRLIDGGIGLDPNVLWFNLTPRKGPDPKPWLRRTEFRQAIAYAVDRQAIADVVYLGAAVPVYGAITPRNTTWFSPSAPQYPHDPAKARQLFAAAGLTDRNGDGRLEDASGRPARISVLVQAAHTVRERTVSVLQQQLAAFGLGLDIVGLDPRGLGTRWQQGDYEAIFHGFQASGTDPGTNLDLWLSSGHSHVWNPGQGTPATEWERQVDALMRKQVAAQDQAERQRIFAEVQRIFGENVPALYFVAPKVTLALSPRVRNETTAPQIPQILWRAETLAVAGGAR